MDLIQQCYLNYNLYYYLQQLSQFWYDEETTQRLSEEAVTRVGKQGSIALISCPTLYPKIKQLASETKG